MSYLDLNQFEEINVVMPGNHTAVFKGIKKEIKVEPLTRVNREYYNFYFQLETGEELYWTRANFNRNVTYQGRTFEVNEVQSALKKLAVATNTKKVSQMVNVPLQVVINEQGFINTVVALRNEETDNTEF